MEGSFTVSLSGEINLHTADDTCVKLETALASGAKQIAVDMEQVSFLGSYGIAEFIRANNHGDEEIVLCHLSPIIHRTLEICGVDELFTIEE